MQVKFVIKIYYMKLHFRDEVVWKSKIFFTVFTEWLLAQFIVITFVKSRD